MYKLFCTFMQFEKRHEIYEINAKNVYKQIIIRFFFLSQYYVIIIYIYKK